jgi:hypothetical protein
MADELNDILSTGAEDIRREQLIKYLEGNLSDAEKHQVEKAMIDSDMLSDAVEGLQSLPDNQRIPTIQNELDARLKKYLAKRNKRKERQKIKGLYWVIVAILIILLVVLVTFAVIYVDRKV